MNKIKWIRPSGSEIETNDSKDVIDYCVSLGWKPAKKKATKKKVTKRATKQRTVRKTSGN